MSHIRYKIHTISAQALIAYAKGYNAEPDRYHYHLNKRETESTIVRQGETYQEDNAIFFQAMCAVKGDDYKHSALDTVLDDLSVLEENGTVATIEDEIHVMTDDDERLTEVVPRIQHGFGDSDLCYRIHRSRRFIQDDDTGFFDEDLRECDPLLLTDRQCIGV